MGDAIFVFGSNLAGRHGKGAALHARKYCGAIYGRGVGRQGNSYAIPTKDANLKSLPLREIEGHIAEFIRYAKGNPGERFFLTAVGCGLAGYQPSQIAPMFRDAPSNVVMPAEFAALLNAAQSATPALP